MHAADKRFLVLIDVLILQPPERLDNRKISDVFVRYNLYLYARYCYLLLLFTK